MRQFSQKGFRIEQLSFEAKVLYSAFLFFAMAAMLVSVAYYSALVGDAPFAGAREYYASETSMTDAADEADSMEGPALELPNEMELRESAPMLLSMSKRKLLEVTHFHLFTLPIFLLVIAHIFMLCPMRPRTKRIAILSGVLSSATHMAAPWLVFFGGAGWAWLMPITGIWMTGSMLVLIVWPGWAMWRPA